jgi:DNA-binding transcriptional LysR family regulator
MRLDPTSLRLFVSVIEEGTIAAAAKKQHLAASAVSKRLSELEGALGVGLFTRSNKGIVPTAAGSALLNLARGLLHNIDDIHAQMREYNDGTRGYVRVFANISSITQFLPAELESFLARYPDVQVRLEEKISSDIQKAVADNAADIGLFTAGPHPGNLETRPYHRDELVLVVPKRHPLTKKKRSVRFSETLDYDYVGLHTGSAMNLQLIRAAIELEKTPKMRIQVTSYDSLCLMVEAGLGIGLLPRKTAIPYVKTLRIQALELDEPWAQRELKICFRAYDSLSVAAKLLVDHLATA